MEICVIYFSVSTLKQNWVFFFFFLLALGSGDLRWKFVSKKIAMIVKEDRFAGRGNRLTMVFMGCNKVILMPNSFVVSIEYKLNFLAEA